MHTLTLTRTQAVYIGTFAKVLKLIICAIYRNYFATSLAVNTLLFRCCCSFDLLLSLSPSFLLLLLLFAAACHCLPPFAICCCLLSVGCQAFCQCRRYENACNMPHANICVNTLLRLAHAQTHAYAIHRNIVLLHITCNIVIIATVPLFVA